MSRRRLTFIVLSSFCGLLLYFNAPHGDLPPQSHTSLSSHGPHESSLPGTMDLHAASGNITDLFSSIFVVSRPVRLDRRAAMEQLRLALGVEWSYIDAISSDDDVVDEIDACLRWTRIHDRLRRFQWPSDSELEELVRSPEQSSLNTSSQWLTPPTTCYPSASLSTTSAPLPLPGSTMVLRAASPDATNASLSPNATAHAEPLTCAVQDRTRGVRFKASLPTHMLLTSAKIACWYSHLTAIRRFAAFGESTGPSGESDDVTDAALILEDDVDMERDVGAKLSEVWGALPPDWDVVFLGHCWSDESRHTALATIERRRPKPTAKIALHPSFAPKCTHAYALSRAGARRILLHLLYPPFAYSRALDQAFAWLVQSGRVKAFSVVPSVMVQHKMYGSDIDGGEDGLGSGWKDRLEHGIVAELGM